MANFEHYTQDLLQEYLTLNEQQHINSALKSVGKMCYEHVIAIINVENLEILETYIDSMTNDNTFTKFIKYAVCDYYINYLHIQPCPLNDERTIYCEAVIPLFKVFGNITRKFFHVWCEKSQIESKAIHLATHNYNLKGFNQKLLDGITF